ncbi:MAG TPA: ABC transporter permease [Streptosporangiaceae bacterium]|nr:ABC transporter permease [Streptosporangiaceae bacterium]
MTAYLARRALQSVAALVLVTLILFFLLGLVPGGPAAAMLGAHPTAAEVSLIRGALGVHSPFLLQYVAWVGQVLHGNLGFSNYFNEPVSALLAASLPRTLALTITSTLLALIVAVPLGLAQALRRGTATDHVLRGLTFVAYGTPSFVLGTVAILIFAVKMHALGAEGPQAAGFGAIIADWHDLTLPVLTLALLTIGVFSRNMRSSAVDSLAEDYVRTARSKGADERRVLRRHVLPNALIPLVTLIGLSIPQIVGGALVTESVFNIRGMGWQIWQAAQHKDFPVVLGFTLVIGVGAVLGSLLADLGYAALDPRVRLVRR